MNSGRAFGGVLALAVLAAGCSAPPAARVNLSGYSAEFKQGYADGCTSAGSRSERRDAKRYRTEPDYRIGWNDGNNACLRR